MKKIVKFTLSQLLILIFYALPVLAAEGGHGSHRSELKDWIWPLVNFAVLVIILYLAGRKPFKEFFRKRTEMIEQSLKEAKEAKELARKTLDEVRERLKNTDREIEDILASARRSGEKEKEAIIAEGEKMKERILEQAKSNIDFELEKARARIKSDAAALALELAEKRMKEKLGSKEQEELIDEYLKKLEGNN
jgi:F-type H+-transporting ATPase subunit b